MIVLLIVAFVSGLLTIFAPCVWPLLPIVLSSSASGGKHRPLGVTLGLLTSFTIITLSLSYLVRAFGLDPDILRFTAVLVILFFGLTLIIPRFSAIIEGFSSRLTNVIGIKATTSNGFLGGFITGLSLGIVWSPCAGPILATIAALSATRAVNSQVVLLTLIYMMGVGLPLFLFSILGNNLLVKSRRLSSQTGRLQQILGVIMVITALLIGTGYDRLLQVKVLSLFPRYSNFLYKLEQSDQIEQQLNRLSGRRDTNSSSSYLPNLGKAPETIGISQWLNSPPLSLSSLKGRVVLIDFWTYSCINCIRTIPFVNGWYNKYKDSGFTVIGVHTPEFEFEKKTDNVAKAIKMFKIDYPVAQDNDFRTWRNYNNLYWPAKYLIDKDGRLRYQHFGEGQYEETEMAIQSLLAETGRTITTDTLQLPEPVHTSRQTPETYLGSKRLARFEASPYPQSGVVTYSSPSVLEDDHFALEGQWTINEEYSESTSQSNLFLNFYANKVFLVITPQTPGDTISVYLDNTLVNDTQSGKDVQDGVIKLDIDRLYELIDLRGQPGRHQLKLQFHNNGTKVFAFTFG